MRSQVEWTWRENGKETLCSAPIDRVAVIVIEAIETYFCATYTQIIHETVARIVPAVRRYRDMGLQVIYAMPFNYIALHYSQHPQRPTSSILPDIDDGIQQLTLPPYHWIYHHSHCSCGQDQPICRPKDKRLPRFHPEIEIEEQDLIVQDHYELYTHCANHGIEYLLYMGFSADQCVLHRPYGSVRMIGLGLHCGMLRDLVGHHITDKRYADDSGRSTTDLGLAAIVAYIEQHIGPTMLSHQIQLQPKDHS